MIQDHSSTSPALIPALIRSVEDLRGPAGRLEALLNLGQQDAPYAAVVCHPHPLFGGTMHNKVVYHAMKALQAFGLPVLRFNFRGAGLSEGATAMVTVRWTTCAPRSTGWSGNTTCRCFSPASPSARA